MEKINDWIDKLLCKVMIWRIRKMWGADCEISDMADAPEEFKSPEDVFNPGRCGSCRAKEMVEWLEQWIELCDYMGEHTGPIKQHEKETVKKKQKKEVLSAQTKAEIKKAVKRAIAEYSETFKKLSKS